MRTFIRSSSVKTPASAKSPTKINLSRVTSKINTGLTISRKGAAPPSPRGIEDSSKSTKKELYMGSSSFSSSSSSSSFLESKPPLPFHHRPPSSMNCTAGALSSSQSETSWTGHGAQSAAPFVGSPEQPEFQPGDRVLVVGQRIGTVRFYGKTSFAPGQNVPSIVSKTEKDHHPSTRDSSDSQVSRPYSSIRKLSYPPLLCEALETEDGLQEIAASHVLTLLKYLPFMVSPVEFPLTHF
ncbi:CAP-Gly domain-containing linker protein 4-like [Lithobates pipiens]